MITEHDLPRPQLVHEHVEEYIWQLMCLIQGCDLITRKPTPHLFALWNAATFCASPYVVESVRNNYLENIT